MTNSRHSYFERELSDVQTLRKTPRAIMQKQVKEQTMRSARARKNATTDSSTQAMMEAQSENLQFVEPNDRLEWKSSGVQLETMNKLQTGRYPIQAKLDLHNLRIADAFQRVLHFLTKCMEERMRTVLIVHGLGSRSTPPAQMKSHVAHWLKQHPNVNAYVTAPLYQGGLGATLVHLKKSRDAKLETKERIARRLG